MENGIKTKNAVQCRICGASADLLECGIYQCQANPNHCGDTFVGIFTDLTYKPDMPRLTTKRLEVLQAFKSFNQPYPPTMAEIAEILGVSRVTAFIHTKRLVKDGYLVKTKSKIRKYIVKENQDAS